MNKQYWIDFVSGLGICLVEFLIYLIWIAFIALILWLAFNATDISNSVGKLSFHDAGMFALMWHFLFYIHIKK